MSEQFWWYVARASGLVSWGLAAASVLWGLALSTRALGKRPKAPWLLDLHRFLGGLTVVFVGVHVGALVADSYAHFGVSEVLVPLASEWKPGPVAWGVVAFYLLVAVEITSLLMKRLPKKVWRAVHLSSYLLFLTATVHTVTAGTDLTNPILRWSIVGTAAAATFFLVYRAVGPGRAGDRPVRADRVPPRTRTSTAA